MAPGGTGAGAVVDGVTAAAGSVRALARGLGRAGAYAARTFAAPSGLRGLAVECAWLAAHAAVYPAGLWHEEPAEPTTYRTDPLPPARRGLIVSDLAAAGTPILLVHGIMDNRSVFTVFRRTLRRRGFGAVHAMNYSLLTGDVRTAAGELGRHVERLLERTGADRLHLVGHSLGGVIARYYVQRMGGSAHVDTVVTLGSPHAGTMAAHLLPTALGRQLRPGSELMAELAAPSPDCPTRFLVVWSRMDQMVVPQRNARLAHPDLRVEELGLRDVGHLALPIDARTMHWVVTQMGRSEVRRHPLRRDRRRGADRPDDLERGASPAS
ncbi:esterase/lipase family protein [Pseudonocardia lacus]|uniref:esterase/lipase family protein n=1 Tax=Pseudonocardia lacus TaxID=2835865 RepID=UPI001BDD3DDE|nr:alpha/beta fold hydrolase [Pseudonocardia lacus]